MSQPPPVPPVPPVAPRESFEHAEHGVPRLDPYHWMGKNSAGLTEYLVAERAFYDSSCAHVHSLVSALRTEMVGRVPDVETSPRWQRLRFSYYTRHRTGNDYAEIVREIRSIATDSKPIPPATGALDDENRSRAGLDTVLDIGSLADDSGYLDLGLALVSPDENLLAYSVDTTGDEVFELRFRDLRTGTDLPDRIPRTYYGGAWSADSQWFFYTVHDQAYRPFQLWRHRIGTAVGGRRGRAGGAGRALRPDRAALAQRRPGHRSGREPRHR